MIYLDYAATTPLHPDVLKTYHELLSKYFFNADSIYDKGIEVNRLQEHSRELIAQMLKVRQNEIIFTSCGSESNSMAIKGIALSYQNRGKHIITTAIEHSSVYHACLQLRDVFGFEVTFLPVDKTGKIKIEDLKNAIRNDTILVSLMHVNNELGSINPIDEVKQLLKSYDKIKLHVDMVQSLAKLPIDLKDIDAASFSAHKINGLKGSGLLYLNQKTNLVPIINGGQQEFSLRGGTSNACSNIALAKTIRLALADQDKKYLYVKDLNQYAREQLQKIPGIVINSSEDGLPHILNLSCLNYKPEVILHDLEAKGIYISTRSACNSKSNEVSRVLKECNIDYQIARSAIRISLSSSTSRQDVDRFVLELKKTMQNIKRQR